LGINSESDKAASLVIGPTSLGMVRIYVESDGIEVPMDFEPDEALDIANELRAAAEVAMATVAATGAARAPNSPETGHGEQPAGNGGCKPDTKPKSKPGIKQGGGGRGG
jgi:hypothetical protein